jgi:hypothetical protein
MNRLGKLLLFVLACLFLSAPLASAATRYAAPGGTGTDPCADPNAACSLYTAADVSAPGTTVNAGDVIELLPGTYSEAAGDLGPFDSVAINGVTVRGASSESVPLIRLQENNSNLGAFQVNEGSLISHLEIENQDDGGYAVSLFDGGTMERAVVRAPDGLSTACNVVSGTIRSSACINEGGGAALGASIGTIGQTFTVVIRNSTAIATGSGSVGVEFNYGAMTEGLVANIDAKGLIAKGISKDVVAKGKETSASGKGAKTTVTLDHSSYATIGTEVSGTGGSASVTPPGTNANITSAPLLAGDLIHQLPGSPTIGKGAVDAKSAPFDVDGESRTGGLAPDIGADELAYSTTTLVKCNPGGTSVGGQVICEVLVEDLDGAPTQPSGSVGLSAGPGLSLPSSCTLNPVSGSSSTCPFVVTAEGAGTHTITASYPGDDLHDGGTAQASLAVAALPATAPILVAVDQPPNTQLKKHPGKRSSKRKANFTFASTEAGSSFECKLDKKPFRACTSPFKKKVGLGAHKFQVRAVNAQGKADPSPAAFSWRVVRP